VHSGPDLNLVHRNNLCVIFITNIQKIHNHHLRVPLPLRHVYQPTIQFSCSVDSDDNLRPRRLTAATTIGFRTSSHVDECAVRLCCDSPAEAKMVTRPALPVARRAIAETSVESAAGPTHYTFQYFAFYLFPRSHILHFHCE
jgi:hypothetical protein